jgi:NhaA family Na+:H+ antiporter
MATDIAFSLAILRLLGKKIPIGLKVFLTAFAIVDDLGAVMIIALFYSSSLQWGLIGIALIILAILFYLSYKQIYYRYIWLFVGVAVWFLFLKAGIHPTIAGVLMALAVPIRRKVDTDTYVSNLQEIVGSICSSEDKSTPLLTDEQIEEIDNLEDWTEKVQSPLQHLEHKLHNWVAFLIMPVFALSNAGVPFDSSQPMDINLSMVIVASLVFGKLLGISLLSWIAIKTNLAEMPAGVSLPQIIGVSLLAGVGFTMSIFVANLAFEDSMYLLDSAKLGILMGSLLAGLAGFLVLRFNKSNQPGQQA